MTVPSRAVSTHPARDDIRGVELAGLVKRLGGVLVIDDLSLAVSPGSLTVLLGPSGSGKSTLLRLISGLEAPDAGTVAIGPDMVAGGGAWVPPERRRIGMVFQDWALFPHLSVGANVAFGVPRVERSAARIGETLALVGLAEMADRPPHTLSGGQQQRVALARALAPRPDVLLLDEPFSNLDAALRRRLRTEVHQLLVSLEVTTVFVTHDQEEAFVLGDQVAVMRQGRIVQLGTPNELYRRPADRWIAGFVGEANLFRGQATGASASTVVGEIQLHDPHHGEVEVMLRPEQLRIISGGDAVVELIEYHGHDATARVRLADGTSMKVRAAQLDVQRGDRVTVEPFASASCAFPVG